MIPKIVHRVWLGPAPMPDEYVEYGRAWERVNPGWEVRTWTEAELPPMRNQAVYDLVDSWSSKSDVVRFELLAQVGGVYADCDVEPRRPLDGLLDGLEAFAGWEIEGHALGTAVIGSVPGHPYYEDVIRQLPESTRRYPLDRPALTTGPGHLTRVYLAGRNTVARAPKFAVFPAAYFFPYLWHEPHRRHDDFPYSYAIHHWAGSWQPGGGA